MIHKTGAPGVAMAVAVLIAGCAQTTAQPLPPSEAPMSTNLPSVTAAALRDAAQQTGLKQEALSVLSAAAVTWPDGSLGCPRPGVMYTMALVPGYRIRIQAGERVLDYHASTRGQLLVCPDGRSVDPAPQDVM